MNQEVSLGVIVKERRNQLGLTQAELGRRVGCAAITIRKIEADTLRPSVQIAEGLAVALNIPEQNHLAFVRLARAAQKPTPLPPPPPIPEEIGGGNLSGRAIRGYVLGERLGVGGYGAVYRAIQTTVEREVAVKIILPKYADRPEFIRRFEAEAQLVARLEHPHIVPLYDYWREPSVAYLVMRLLRGGNLETALKAGLLPRETILAMIEQICAGLHAAHRAGVIHRDIKPANILLDEDGNAYLGDFGIAKNLIEPNGANLTQGEVIIGSPAYISPEQIMAEPVKPQADIYSLGVMLYELLSGHKPFKGPTPIAYIQQHLHEPLPLLATAQNGQANNGKRAIPTPLDIVIGRATAKEPGERYPDILSMLADVRRALEPGSTAADLVNGYTAPMTPPHVAAMIDLPDLENPYKGLRPFAEADAADFFGRETLIQALLARLTEANDISRFLAVVGPSGGGKSSVVRAGLMPAVRNGGLPGSEQWFMVEMIPGRHPLEELEASLLRVAINPPESLLAQLRQDERGLLRAVQRILPAEAETELLLVIDQFEEIFTLVEEEKVRAHFLDSLVTAILDPRSRLRVIITLRADFTDRPLQYVDFGELVRQRTEFVLPLTPEELEEAIIKPTERAGLTLEAGLAPTIIGDIGHEPGALPLLQYALTELFERRHGRRLTLAAYRESGGVLGALARRADELYEGLNEAGQEAAHQLFLRLITLGEGVEDTRRRVLRSELAAIQLPSNSPQRGEDSLASPPAGGTEGGPGATTLDSVIGLYGRYRLLTFDHDPVTRGPTVEVAHEALLREWGRLRGWLDDSRADIRRQRMLASAADEWLQAEREEGYLLRGARLDQFEGWAEETAIALTGAERTYLEASLAAQRERQAAEEVRRQRELETAQKLASSEAQAAGRLRWLAVGLAIFLVVALGLSWFAFGQRNQAQANLRRAERIRLAAQAQIALDRGEDLIIPALLALRSLQYGYSAEADAALLSALSRGFARQQFIGHTDAMASAVFSPDGQYVLTAANDTTARLWDTQTGQEIRQFSGHTEFVSNAIFFPDGKHILTSSADRTVRLWDAETGQEVRRLPDHSSPVWALAISPNGQTILTSDESGSAWLWDSRTTQLVHELSGHGDLVLWGAFSPDGRTVFTASLDKTARLWDVQTGQELRRFEGHAAAVSGGQFSPDGRFLATASYDNTARLWDVETGQEVRRFMGHTNVLQDAIFSPDGRYLLTGSHDKTARLWDVASGQELRQFIGHTSGVSTAVFSPDGQNILTSSADRTALLWDISIESEPRIFSRPYRTLHAADVVWMGFSSEGGHVLTGNGDGTVQTWNIQTGQIMGESSFAIDGFITDLTFSSDNALALTASGEGVARLWEVESGQELSQFTAHTGAIWAADFSPDSRAIVTGSDDGTARVWDLRRSGTELHQLAGHAGPVHTAAFSPDGRYVLTGSDDRTARLWDAQTGQEIRQFSGHAGPVLGVAFSPDGQTILTGSSDQTAWLWEVESGQAVRQFIGHTDQVWVVAFSPDGRYVLTGSDDRTARLWDAATGQIVRQFVGHVGPLRSLAFSADGRYVLTGDFEQAYLWQTNLADLIALTCAQLPRDFTADERALYAIAADRPTCIEPNVEAIDGQG